jgi:hypothetical protein
MSRINTLAVTAALLSVSAFADTVALRAEDNPPMITLKPMSGPGASSPDHRFLLNEIVGKKQAISYFLNENGLCKVTVMVGDAFNGTDVSEAAAVRFQVVLGVGARARMDTAEGSSLEFVCRERAQVLTVKTGSRPRTYPSGT